MTAIIIDQERTTFAVSGVSATVVSAGGRGARGLNAYQLAVADGFVGTEQQWLDSLVGETGATGADGADGADGLSAYEIAVAGGFVGTEQQWLDSLMGATGATGPQGEPGTPAARTPVTLYTSNGAEWSDSVANAAFASAGLTKADNDSVVMSLISVPSANQIFGLSAEGQHGSTTFVDLLSHTVTSTNIIISTLDKFFGGSSAYSDGTAGNKLSITSTDFNFGSGDFTIKAKIKLESGTASYGGVFDNRVDGAAGIGIYVTNTGNLAIANNSGIIAIWDAGFSTSAWKELLVVKESGVIYGFSDGILLGSVADNRTYTSNTFYLFSSVSGQTLKGFLDDICIWNTALYTSTYTMSPTAQGGGGLDKYAKKYWNGSSYVTELSTYPLLWGSIAGQPVTLSGYGITDAQPLNALLTSISAGTWTGATSITTLGTIETGTWNATAIADNKIASALTGKTYNSLTLTALSTGYSIAGGTTSKTLTVSNTLALAGTDSSTLNIGAGGTLNSLAYITETTWAVKPAASSNSGKYIRVTDVGYNGGSIWQSDGTNWRPISQLLLDVLEVPVGIAQAWTAGNDGALTGLSFRTDNIYYELYLYFPANGLYSGSSAGFYYVVMTSISAGTVYNNNYTPGTNKPLKPVAPTAFTYTGAGAKTQTTSEITAYQYTMKGGLLGKFGVLKADAIIDQSAVIVDVFYNTNATRQTTLGNQSTLRVTTKLLDASLLSSVERTGNSAAQADCVSLSENPQSDLIIKFSFTMSGTNTEAVIRNVSLYGEYVA